MVEDVFFRGGLCACFAGAVNRADERATTRDATQQAEVAAGSELFLASSCQLEKAPGTKSQLKIGGAEITDNRPESRVARIAL